MQIQIRSGNLSEQTVDAIVLGVAPGRALTDEAAAIDAEFDGKLKQVLDDNDFSGKVGTTLVIPTLGQIPGRRLVITGIGDANKRTAFDLTRAWGAAARAARSAG